MPWGKNNSDSLEIVVNKVYNLNSFIETLETAAAQQTKTLGCLCFASRPISVNVVLAKTGYVCGEKINIKAKVRIKYFSPTNTRVMLGE